MSGRKKRKQSKASAAEWMAVYKETRKNNISIGEAVSVNRLTTALTRHQKFMTAVSAVGTISLY